MEEKEKIYFIRLDCGADKNLMVAALEKMGGTIGHFERMKLDELKPDDKTHYDCLALFAGESPDGKHILLGNTETLRESGNYDAKELLFYPYYEEFHDEDWEITALECTLFESNREIHEKSRIVFKFNSLAATNDAYKMFAYATDNNMQGIAIEDDNIVVTNGIFNVFYIHDQHDNSISVKKIKMYRSLSKGYRLFDNLNNIEDYECSRKRNLNTWSESLKNAMSEEEAAKEKKSYLQWEDDAVKVNTDPVEDAEKRAHDYFEQQLQAGQNKDEASSKIFGNSIPNIPMNEEITLNKEGCYNVASDFDVIVVRRGELNYQPAIGDADRIILKKRWTLKDAKPGDIIIFENNTVVGNKKIYVVFKSYNEFADSNNKGNIESEMWAYGFINYDDTLHAEEISYDSSYIKSMKHRLAAEWEVREFETMLREQYRKRWNKELLKFEDIIPEWLQEGEQPRYFTVKFDATRRNGPFYTEIVDFTNSEEDITRIEQGLVFKSTYEAEPYVTAQNEAYKKINEEYLKK